ncbi:UNVERIFIED_CONTAM: hypothetical protein RMT77_011845 [Armadillidium vulgare]
MLKKSASSVLPINENNPPHFPRKIDTTTEKTAKSCLPKRKTSATKQIPSKKVRTFTPLFTQQQPQQVKMLSPALKLPQTRTETPGPPERPRPRTETPGPPERPRPRTETPGPPERPRPRTETPGPPERPRPRTETPGPPERPRPRTETNPSKTLGRIPTFVTTNHKLESSLGDVDGNALKTRIKEFTFNLPIQHATVNFPNAVEPLPRDMEQISKKHWASIFRKNRKNIEKKVEEIMRG